MTKREEYYVSFASAAVGGGLFMDFNHPFCGAVLIIVGFIGLIMTYLNAPDN